MVKKQSTNIVHVQSLVICENEMNLHSVLKIEN